MRDRLRKGIIVSLAAAAVGLASFGCAGRSVSRAVTSTPPPPVADWERPARMSDSVPAVRLDKPRRSGSREAPAVCGDDCEDEADGKPPGVADPGAGVRVSLMPGMTLYSLARAYRVSLQSIIDLNGIRDPNTIRAGTEISIPASGVPAAEPPAPPRARRNGRPRTADRAPEPDEEKDEPISRLSIAWPLDGRITGGFGQRGRHHHHDGLDIDGTEGEEVRAVATGTVVRSGSEGKYGKTVVIDHGGGVSTLYAHASRLLVREGDEVEQGEAIAEVGATGNAHGTHLHFEVRRDGRPVDPLPYLDPDMMGSSSRRGQRP